MTVPADAPSQPMEVTSWLNEIRVQRVALKIRYIRETSEVWSRKRLRHLVSRPLSNKNLFRVEARRRQLSRLPPHRLHPSYDTIKINASTFKVTPDSISISPVYGHVLYSLVADLRPSIIVEAGSGLGISGMYMCCALGKHTGSRFLSFEKAEYCDIAQDSVSLMATCACVFNGDFHRFSAQLEPHETISFAFLDGQHTTSEIMKSYKNLVGWLHEGAMIIIDDVSYSEATFQLWTALAKAPAVSFAAVINERLGVLVR